jgi:hypothetical protein
MSKKGLPFGRKNYIIMLSGLAVLVVGFVIMSMDTAPYGFGFFGLTLGPIVVMSGFMIQFFAIMHNPDKDK